MQQHLMQQEDVVQVTTAQLGLTWRHRCNVQLASITLTTELDRLPIVLYVWPVATVLKVQFILPSALKDIIVSLASPLLMLARK